MFEANPTVIDKICFFKIVSDALVCVTNKKMFLLPISHNCQMGITD